MSAPRIALFISFVTLGIMSQHYAASIKVPVNGTSYSDEDKATESLQEDYPNEESEEQLRERYRRLIPYMTYYLNNNYLGSNQQAGVSQTFVTGPPEGLVVRRPTTPQVQFVTLRPAGKNRFQVQGDRFVPSVQYDPKEPNSDDYFVPVTYGNKETYDDYGSVTLRTTRPTPINIPETHYQSTVRPSINYLVSKPKAVKSAPPDYPYAPEEFESIRFPTKLRYIQQQPQQQQLQSVVPRPTTLLEPVAVPNVSPVGLNHVIKSLQLTNQLPEVLNKDNIDSSIKTLTEILHILNMGKKDNYAPVTYSKYKPTYTKPKVITETNYEASQISVTPHNELVNIKPSIPYENPVKSPSLEPEEQVVEIKPMRPYPNQVKAHTPAPLPTTSRLPEQQVNKFIEYYVPIVQDLDEQKETYKPVTEQPAMKPSTEPTLNTYSVSENQDEILEDERYTLPETTEKLPHKISTQLQRIPPPPAFKYGATRGKPHVDYPAYTEIPKTQFSCKQQRYKGFFGDPETGCQVWHYCDLNGGKSSFLCPNGTIFSQVALTCDWWFNVKCESTTQLYVLNERLYKYILPIMPKFPEDYTGPEVDKYLELKFKEMEAKMSEKKKGKDDEEKDKNVVNTLQSIEDSK